MDDDPEIIVIPPLIVLRGGSYTLDECLKLQDRITGAIIELISTPHANLLTKPADPK